MIGTGAHKRLPRFAARSIRVSRLPTVYEFRERDVGQEEGESGSIARMRPRCKAPVRFRRAKSQGLPLSTDASEIMDSMALRVFISYAA